MKLFDMRSLPDDPEQKETDKKPVEQVIVESEKEFFEHTFSPYSIVTTTECCTFVGFVGLQVGVTHLISILSPAVTA